MAHLVLDLPYAGFFTANTQDSASVFVGTRLVTVQLESREVRAAPAEKPEPEACDSQRAHRLEYGAEELAAKRSMGPRRCSRGRAERRSCQVSSALRGATASGWWP